MRILIAIICIIATIACAACYSLGFRSGLKQSRLEEEQRVLVLYALSGCKAVETTNYIRIKNLFSIELLGSTRAYERQFGVPTGTNKFVKQFAEAKKYADQVEKSLVSVAGAAKTTFGSNVTVKAGN